MRVISFHTDEWRYSEYAEELREDCERLGLPYRIEAMPSAGAWLDNCCLKPAYILRCLEDEGGPVLWVDVDGSILAPLAHFDADHSELDFQGARIAPPRRRVWHVGTMWWNHTPAALTYIKRWIENTGPCTDESAMEHTWHQLAHSMRVGVLPPQYHQWVHHDMKIPKGTVIVHRSSRSRSKLNGGMQFAAKYEEEVF